MKSSNEMVRSLLDRKAQYEEKQDNFPHRYIIELYLSCRFGGIRGVVWQQKHTNGIEQHDRKHGRFRSEQ